MNDAEIADFWKQCFIQFPTLKAWLHDNSPDMPATLAVWSNALRGITASEALSVLTRWSSGELDPPTGYQRETFHLHVKAVVMNDRSKRYGSDAREEAFRKANINGPRPEIFVKCGEVFAKVADIVRQFDNGSIERSAMKSQIDEIVADAHRQIERRTKGVI
jgi:hypothetical protein